jgi:hypothetical protein
VGVCFPREGALEKKPGGECVRTRSSSLTDMKGYIFGSSGSKKSFLSKKEHHKAKISFLLASYFSYLNFPATQKKLFLTQIDRLITRAREHTKTKTTRRIDGEHSFSREFHITRFAITFIV